MEYIAIITAYDKNGKTLAIRYDRWSGNTEFGVMDTRRIRSFIEAGVYDQNDNFGEYAQQYGCTIRVLRCEEVALIQIKPTQQ